MSSSILQAFMSKAFCSLNINRFISIATSGLILSVPHFSQAESYFNCHTSPKFLSNLNISNPAISSQEERRPGLWIVSLSNPSIINQPSSWETLGSVGSFVITEDGDIFTAKVPQINTLHTNFLDLNSIFKIDSLSGEAKEFYKFDSLEYPSLKNPYGIINLSYDCSSNNLAVSVLSGSSYEEEKGRIFILNPKTKAIVAQIKDFDAYGISYFYYGKGARKFLLLGSARNSALFSVRLDSDNQVIGRPKRELIIDKFNILKAKKIVQISDNQIKVTTTEFNYSLIGQSEFDSDVRTYEFDGVGFKQVNLK